MDNPKGGCSSSKRARVVNSVGIYSTFSNNRVLPDFNKLSNFSGLMGFACGCVVYIFITNPQVTMFIVVRYRGTRRMIPWEMHIYSGRLRFCVMCILVKPILHRKEPLPPFQRPFTGVGCSPHTLPGLGPATQPRSQQPRWVWRSTSVLFADRSRSHLDLSGGSVRLEQNVYLHLRVSEYGTGEIAGRLRRRSF